MFDSLFGVDFGFDLDNSMSSIVITIGDGYELSIIYGNGTCSNDGTVEIAALRKGYLIVPSGMESFYSSNAVIGWQREDQVKAFCIALCKVAGVPYTHETEITTTFADRW